MFFFRTMEYPKNPLAKLMYWFRRKPCNPTSLDGFDRSTETIVFWAYHPDNAMGAVEMPISGGLHKLCEFPNLKNFIAYNADIIDEDLQHFSQLTQLENLFLYDSRITNKGLKHLEGLTQLKTLYVRHTKVTERGRLQLQSVLPNLEIDKQKKVELLIEKIEKEN